MLLRIKTYLRKLLLASEQYTKTDMLYLASGGFWLTAGQAVASFSAFALSIVFANFLTPQVYGTYKYVLSLAGIFAFPTLFGISTSLQRAIARSEDNAAKRALRAKLIGGVVAALGAGAAALWYFANGNNELGLALTIVAIGIPFMEAYGLYDNVLQGKGLFRTSTIYFTTSSLAATTALIAAIFVSGGSLVVLLFTYFAAWAIARIVAWQLVLPLLTERAETTQGEVVTYGVRLSLIGALNVIANNIDKIILFQWLGPAELAIYSFATAIPEQLRAALKAITPLALSRFSRRSAEDIQSSIHRKALLSVLTTLPFVGLYILAAPYIYQILFPAYIDSIIYSQVFALSILVVPAFLYTAALQSQRAEKIIAITDISLSIVGLLLVVILIPVYGVWGAVGARVAGRFISALVLSVSVRYL